MSDTVPPIVPPPDAPADAPAVRLSEAHGRGRYALDLPDGSQAELTFTRDADGDMVIDHTFTPPRHRGRGVAATLLARAVADAQATGARIVPLCPYVATEFRHRPEWGALAKR